MFSHWREKNQTGGVRLDAIGRFTPGNELNEMAGAFDLPLQGASRFRIFGNERDNRILGECHRLNSTRSLQRLGAAELVVQ